MIIFHPQAQQELLEAAAFYEEQLIDLGTEFLSVIEQTTDKIEENPKAYYLSHPELEIRRCVVQRFPFLVYFRLKTEFIEVYAIAHQSKKPDYWLRRTALH